MCVCVVRSCVCICVCSCVSRVLVFTDRGARPWCAVVDSSSSFPSTSLSSSSSSSSSSLSLSSSSSSSPTSSSSCWRAKLDAACLTSSALSEPRRDRERERERYLVGRSVRRAGAPFSPSAPARPHCAAFAFACVCAFTSSTGAACVPIL